MLLSFSCDRQSKAPQVVEFSGQTMGSGYSVKYVPGEKTPSLPEVRALVDRRLVELNQSISTYVKDSEISLLNHGEVNQWHYPSAEFMRGLKIAKEVSSQTQGSYDPTVGPLVNLWGFGPSGPRLTPPSEEEIAKARSQVGLDKLEIDFEQGRLRRLQDGVYLDLSSIGQGLGIDMIRDILESLGVESYLINIAGELTAKGEKPEGPWTVAIEAPHRERGVVQRLIELNNMALCTSGNYRQFFEAEGKRYAHTMDPTTGIPVQHRLISASVLNKRLSSARADAWATALLSVGPERAIELAEAHQLMAYFIIEQGEDTEEKYQEIFSSLWLEHFPQTMIQAH